MDALLLTWSGIISFAISSCVTYFLHIRIVKHLGIETAKLIDIHKKNEEVLKKMDLQIAKSIKDVELKNNKELIKVVCENERLLKRIERNIEIKERSQIVAELFTLWIQTLPGPSQKQLTPDDFAKLNRYSFECSLWLPRDIFHDLSAILTNTDVNEHYKIILKQIRMYLNPDLGEIDENTIIHW
jgi:hypothetical protein